MGMCKVAVAAVAVVAPLFAVHIVRPIFRRHFGKTHQHQSKLLQEYAGERRRLARDRTACMASSMFLEAEVLITRTNRDQNERVGHGAGYQ